MATKPSQDYTVVPNSALRGESHTSTRRISIEARWLLCYGLSRPDDWVFRRNHLAELAGVSEKTITRMFSELIEAGLCQRSRAKGEGGRLGLFDTTFTPVLSDTTGQKRPMDQPDHGTKNHGTESTHGEMSHGTTGQNHHGTINHHGEMSRLVSTEGIASTKGSVASTEGIASTEGLSESKPAFKQTPESEMTDEEKEADLAKHRKSMERFSSIINKKTQAAPSMTVGSKIIGGRLVSSLGVILRTATAEDIERLKEPA